MGNIFGFYKTRHILLSDSANCTVLHTVVLTQYRRVLDGNAIARTALAMRALRRAVKKFNGCVATVLQRSVPNLGRRGSASPDVCTAPTLC